MFKSISKYYTWLHGKWPDGKVEKLPIVDHNGNCNLKNVKIIGDLSGIPLLKFASLSASKAVRSLISENKFSQNKKDDKLDVVIIGAGISGISAAIEAKKNNLKFKILESTEIFHTIKNFPKKKPIFTYPTDLKIDSGLEFRDKPLEKESLLADIIEQANKAKIEITNKTVKFIQKKRKLIFIHLSNHDKTNNTEIIKAKSCIIAIGRSGNYRKLNVPGEDLDKVSNRMHDPKDFTNKNVAVIGGGDSALETALSLAEANGKVSLIYRGDKLTRPKPENIEKVLSNKKIDKYFGYSPTNITKNKIILKNTQNKKIDLENDNVFSLIGREAPLDFFRRSKIKILGEKNTNWWLSLFIFFIFCLWLYHWKTEKLFEISKYLPFITHFNLKPIILWDMIGTYSEKITNASLNLKNLIGTFRVSSSQPSFYYSLTYTLIIVIFGLKRIFRRKTSYVKFQTTSLMLIQIIPLFLLPEIILPYLGYNGAFGKSDWTFMLKENDAKSIQKIITSEENKNTDYTNNNSVQSIQSILKSYSLNLARYKIDTLINPIVAVGKDAKVTINSNTRMVYLQHFTKEHAHFIDNVFPKSNYSHGREYWRAYGFIFAWPLFIHNWFTNTPMWFWLILGIAQTFIIIPLIVKKWGKGSYCSWICSCGALAETLGDQHRHKMPHGKNINKLNMIGQIFLAFATLLMLLRILSWTIPGHDFAEYIFYKLTFNLPLINYNYFVDLIWAGIFGVVFYFHFSGRFWCRFACPLAALMHIYHRLFGRFRIFVDKKKCISCNICTSVCHQGIDVMNFANKDIDMSDPECVRCSACVQTCPTGVLKFGHLNKKGHKKYDKLIASEVHVKEIS